MHFQRACFLIGLALAFTTVACGRKAPSLDDPAERPRKTATGDSQAKALPARADLTDRELLAQVSQRLRTVMDPFPDFVAPTAFEMVDEDHVNAFATAKFEGQGEHLRVLPRVVVSQGMLDIEGDLAPTPAGFWAVDLPPKTLQVWDHLNSLGRDYYATTFRPLLDRDAHPA
jgi:hypothetical protein